MSALKDDIATYDAMRGDLETEHLGKWVLLHDKHLVGIYDSFDAVAQEAVRKFGRGPYLIRQIGAPPVTIPASLMYQI